MSLKHAMPIVIVATLLSVAVADVSPPGDSATASAFGPAEGAELIRQIRASRIDATTAVRIENIQLEMGAGVLDIQHGTLFPARIGDGRVSEVIFSGDARFRLAAPDAIEARQLELFTSRRRIDVSVSQAVMVLANASAMERLLEGEPVVPEPELLERLEETHERWLEQPERRTTGVESSIFKVLVGDGLYDEYFALWASSYEIGDFVFQLDPEEEEQMTLASFTPVNVRGWDRLRLARQIRIQQRKGRWLGVRVQDLGAWDVWHSAEWKPLDLHVPGNASFEAVHYELDVKIKRDRLKLEGVARVDLHTQVDGRRTLMLDLFGDLLIDRVTDQDGVELYSFRSGNDNVVLLPEPSVAGERFTLEIAYHGRVLTWVGRRAYDLAETGTWYPRVGAVDRATHDVKLTWPKKHQLIASGRLVESGEEKRYRWERRTLDRPATDFSFVLGDFVVETHEMGDVDLTVAFDTAAPSRLTPALRSKVVQSIVEAFEYYEKTFGPYPLDYLTVATVPRRYSQSYFGFIVLTDSIVQDDDAFGNLRVDQLRHTLVAHEMAHQWWGNLVGWWSYRDQWLSEAMSNYCSLLYYANRQGRDSTFLAQMSAGWRNQLGQRAPSGHTIESLGPVVLGGRLNSSLSSEAYEAIVYRKGAVVLAMLARAIGEEPFLQMLRSFVETLGDDVLTTETFIAGMERMSGLDLDGFAERFIYGTGIPAVYYDYDAQPAEDGTWTVRGKATLYSEPNYAFRVTRSEGDGWDVARTPLEDRAAPASALMVPYRIEQRPQGPVRSTGVSRGVWGRLMIEGEYEEFTLQAATEPAALQLDPRGETLAHFYPVKGYPKRGLRLRAADLLGEGRVDEAEHAFLEALELGSRHRPAATGLVPGVGLEDARIHLSLSRLYADQRRFDEAARHLQAAELLLVDNDRLRLERDVMTSRLEILQGDYRSAWRRLRRALRVLMPDERSRTYNSVIRQIQLSAERHSVAEALALLAVASFEMDKSSDYRWSLAAAVERGVDVTPLEAVAGR